MGEEGLKTMLMATIETGRKLGLLKQSSVDRVIVDTTLMPKAIAHPTDGRLLDKSGQKLAAFARREGLAMRRNYNREAPRLAAQIGRYAHARQYRRLNKSFRTLRSRVGRVMRDIARQLERVDPSRQDRAREILGRANRILTQKTSRKNKLHAFHAPEVECISKSTKRTPYELGARLTVAKTLKEGFVVGMRSMPCNPYDVYTLAETIEQVSILAERTPRTVIADRGYRGGEHDGIHVLRFGPKRGTTCELHGMMKRRSAIEPTIGHMKTDGQPGRNWPNGTLGDAMHAVLCSAGHNVRLLLRTLREFFARLIATLLAAMAFCLAPLAHS